MAKKKWMQRARASMERRGTVGSFTRAAKRAGMSVQGFARKVLSKKNKSKYSPAMRRKAGFAKGAGTVARRRKKG